MTVLGSAVEVSVVLAVGLALVRLLRRRSAALRHWVLSAAVVGACLTPIAGRVAPAWSVAGATRAWPVLRWSEPDLVVERAVALPDDTARPPAATGSSVTVPPSSPTGPALMPSDLVTWLGRAAFWLWALGTAAGFLMLSVGLMRLRLMTAASHRVTSGRWRELADEVSRVSGIRRPIALFKSEHPVPLVTWGWVRPRVMLPSSTVDWSDERIRVVLWHEIAHVARGDWAIQLVAESLLNVFWFNPLAWIVCARLRQESELACDDVVLSNAAVGTSYATHLLDLARSAPKHRQVWLPAPAIVRPSKLEQRIAAMLNPNLDRTRGSSIGRTGAALAFVVVAVLAAGLTSGAQSTNISGTVLDQAGHAIPGAEVILTNRETRVQSRLVVDALGRFSVTGLPPGEYSRVVRHPGFMTLSGRFSPGPGDIELKYILGIGRLEETITVTPASDPAAPVATQSISPAERQEQIARIRGGTIQPPFKVYDVAPRFPEALRDSRYDGTVVLDAVLKADGIVEIVQILAPVDPTSMMALHPDPPRAAVEAVEQWRYEPTRLHDVPVDTPINITVRFDGTRH